jgi:hypothetical protein
MGREITWGELITLVLFVLGTALLVYLIMAVSNLLRVLKNVNQLIEKNKDHINNTVEKLPEISSNTAQITGMVKDNLETIGKVVEDVGKISDTVKNGVETIQKDIILKAKSVLDIFVAIKHLFEKKKENSKKKKGTVYKYKYRPGQDKPEEVEVLTSEIEADVPHPDYEKVELGQGTTEDINDYKTAEEV